jgi:hypothetical protein
MRHQYSRFVSDKQNMQMAKNGKLGATAATLVLQHSSPYVTARYAPQLHNNTVYRDFIVLYNVFWYGIIQSLQHLK